MQATMILGIELNEKVLSNQRLTWELCSPVLLSTWSGMVEIVEVTTTSRMDAQLRCSAAALQGCCVGAAWMDVVPELSQRCLRPPSVVAKVRLLNETGCVAERFDPELMDSGLDGRIAGRSCGYCMSLVHEFKSEPQDPACCKFGVLEKVRGEVS